MDTPPDNATDVKVFAPKFQTLQVNWTNPSDVNGPLLSSKAIAFSSKTKVAECGDNLMASSPVTCSLTKLNNCAVYDVVLEVCTGPPKDVPEAPADKGSYCTKASYPGHPTLPGGWCLFITIFHHCPTVHFFLNNNLLSGCVYLIFPGRFHSF
ncbi:unnamed protein product [Dibothriocephalus latus]|uniref:Fibronectin type-III domain-containing protein n=1 Tax=Dibothriocephalus latus TaxID=60516 RepID=A0A3P7NSP2_DIBLA|nr:unnamed protein product [Dibothriocephalus latus]